MGAWQYSGAGLVNKYFSIGSAALFASLATPVLVPLVLKYVLKCVGGAFVRLMLNTVYKREFPHAE